MRKDFKVATSCALGAYLLNSERILEWSAADKQGGLVGIEEESFSSVNNPELPRNSMDKTNPEEITMENLRTSGIDDYAVQITELYQRIMETYSPVERAYRAAVEVHDSMNGFANSTNS